MDGPTEAPMSLGERFRAAREQRGLSLSDVAEQIRIRSVYLAAIEEENWPAIGAGVYVRGFLRTYARFLGLDPESAVAEFNASSATAGASEKPASRSFEERGGQRSERSLAPLLWIAGAVAIALIAFVVYLYVSPPRTTVASAPGGPAAQASSAPSAQPSAPPAPPLVKKDTLGIHVTDASWMRVTVDGNVTIEGTFPAGTTKTFHGKLALVRVGNAGGVEVTVNGKPLGKLGATGDVVEKTYTL